MRTCILCSSKAKTQRLQDKYELAKDASYICISAPVPFNIVVLLRDVVLYFTRRKILMHMYPESRFVPIRTQFRTMPFVIVTLQAV